MFIKNISLRYVFVAAFLFLGASFAYANTTGFTTETVEIQKSSIVEGDEVELLVRFANFEEKTLTGKISFYDADVLLGSRELNLEGGQSGEYIITWQATLGEHSFIAKAESLKLEGSNVAILGPSTTPKEFMIGFKSSSVAENLRQRGGFAAVVAGVMDETQEFFATIIKNLDVWRMSKIQPLQETQERIAGEKEETTEKMRAIIVVHGIIVAILIFIVTKKIVFFALVAILLFWLLSKIVQIFKRIIRKDYSQE